MSRLGLVVYYWSITGLMRVVNGSLHSARLSHSLTAVMAVAALVAVLAALAGLCAGLWIGFAMVVRRWHDRGRSWAWALLGFVPVVGWLWQGIECGFLEGTLGPNAFGPSPKGIAGVFYGDPLADTFA